MQDTELTAQISHKEHSREAARQDVSYVAHVLNCNCRQARGNGNGSNGRIGEEGKGGAELVCRSICMQECL